MDSLLTDYISICTFSSTPLNKCVKTLLSNFLIFKDRKALYTYFDYSHSVFFLKTLSIQSPLVQLNSPMMWHEKGLWTGQSNEGKGGKGNDQDQVILLIFQLSFLYVVLKSNVHWWKLKTTDTINMYTLLLIPIYS